MAQIEAKYYTKFVIKFCVYRKLVRLIETWLNKISSEVCIGKHV